MSTYSIILYLLVLPPISPSWHNSPSQVVESAPNLYRTQNQITNKKIKKNTPTQFTELSTSNSLFFNPSSVPLRSFPIRTTIPPPFNGQVPKHQTLHCCFFKR
ncbi:hypothetical protein B0J14DRAFT_108247 [Halenospora varia]|nr:hypothetical protein B0J14DRAFT_108247 [Halenospora varia]